jgi:hypothetical protein
MFCARCDEPILPGQRYSVDTVETGSGAAPEIRLHLTCHPNRVTQPSRMPVQRHP